MWFWILIIFIFIAGGIIYAIFFEKDIEIVKEGEF